MPSNSLNVTEIAVLKPFQGFIPAAGLGSRMGPLTDITPKPLIPIGLNTPLQLAYAKLIGAGCRSIAINSHHLADQIRLAALSLSRSLGTPITVSHETQLLGTGGYFGPLGHWLGNQDVLVYNSDILSDIDLVQLVKAHQDSGALATMALLKTTAGDKTRIFINEGNDIVGIGSLQSSNVTESTLSHGSFTGIHVLSQKFIELLSKDGPCDIIAVYKDAISAGKRIHSVIHSGLWYDVGDPLSFWGAYKDILFDQQESSDRRRRLGMELQLSSPHILSQSGGACEVNGSFVGANCWVVDQGLLKPGSRISNSIILPGGMIKPGETIDRQVLGYGVRLAIK